MSVQVTRLPSGLTVVTDNMPHLQTASLGVWVGSGARDELQNEHGISHLLEHMAFKGTRRRSARQIAEEIEMVGGDINAATSSETTAYTASVLRADIPLALDVLSDILANPTFDKDELKREQNVIVQEIGASEDNPDDIVFDYLQNTAFPNQPIGRAILGTRESVRSFQDQNLRTYLSRNYRAPDMVVAATGSVDHAAVVAEAERRFAGFDGPAAPVPQPATFGGGVKLEARDLEQVHIALALEGLSQKDPQYFSLQVFAIVLGGGMSSRLFQEVREKRGLCYTISAFHAPYADTGMFGIYSGTGPIFRWQHNLTAAWNRGDWSAGLVNRYKSGYTDANGVNKVPAYSLWDAYGTWQATKALTLTAGIRNLLDKDPPLSTQTATFQVGYDPRYTDPLGRVYYVRGTYSF